MQVEPNRFYSVPEVCQIFQISRGTLERLLASKRLAAAKVGRAWRIRGADILTFYESQKTAE